MSIPKLSNHADFDSVFNNAKLLVIYFTAQWCGPCQHMSPIIDQLSTSFTNVTFLKIDIDDFKQLASRFSITSIPTFIFVKEGTEIERVRGASQQIGEEIQKLSRLDPQAERYPIGGNEGSSVAVTNINDQEVSGYIPQGFGLLNNGIFFNEVEFMNVEDKDGSAVKGILGKKDVEVENIHSDMDSQLLIHIPLINVAKVHSILVKSKDVEGFQKPNLFKIWINNNNIISFDDAGSLNSLNDNDKISFWNDNGWTEIKLKFVRFQKVKSLDLFFDGEDEDTQTLIEKIVIVGIDGESVKQATIAKE